MAEEKSTRSVRFAEEVEEHEIPANRNGDNSVLEGLLKGAGLGGLSDMMDADGDDDEDQSHLPKGKV